MAKRELTTKSLQGSGRGSCLGAQGAEAARRAGATFENARDFPKIRDFQGGGVYIYTYVYACMCVHIFMHIYICMYVCVLTVRVYIYIHMYVCM